MPKGKKKRSKQSLVSKAINTALIALGFSRPLVWLFGGAPLREAVDGIMDEATFGLSKGKFSLDKGLRMYSPVGAAVALGKLKSYLMRQFPVRR